MSKTITGVMPIRTVGLTPGHRWCGELRSVKPAVNNGKGARGLVQGPNSLNSSYTHPGRISGRPRKLASDLRNRHLVLLTKNYDEEAAKIWARERLPNRINAIIIHELAEAEAGTHESALRLAPEAERPISEGTGDSADAARLEGTLGCWLEHRSTSARAKFTPASVNRYADSSPCAKV